MDRTGLFLALAAFLIWAFLPLLFKNIEQVANLEILAWRILSAMVTLIAVGLLTRSWPAIFRLIRTPRVLGILAITAALNLINWLTFIMATRSGHVLEISLGYFINPLVNVALGMVLLRERIGKMQGLAVSLAAIGVLIMAFHSGGTLWISLTLAFTFAIYGLVRKVIAVGPLEGVTIEMLLLTPIATAFLIAGATTPAAGYSAHNIVLLAFAGPLTALPLFLYAAASRRMPYSALGMIQYVGPSLQFCLAIWLGEPLRAEHFMTFAFIWVALAIFAVDGVKRVRSASAPIPLPE